MKPNTIDRTSIVPCPTTSHNSLHQAIQQTIQPVFQKGHVKKMGRHGSYLLLRSERRFSNLLFSSSPSNDDDFSTQQLHQTSHHRLCASGLQRAYHYCQSVQKNHDIALPILSAFHNEEGRMGGGGGGVGGNVGFYPICWAATIAPPLISPATTAATTTTATATAATSGGISLLQFLFAFTAGGLFFSSALAAVSAVYALGMDNIRHIWNICMVILKNIWVTFTMGLRATKQVLLDIDNAFTEGEAGDENSTPKKKWKWKSAWTELKKQLGETKKSAAQGVKALRQEAKLYNAALGPPGLVPLQYVVDRLMPLSLAGILEENIRTALTEFPKSKTIKKMTLSNFEAGERAPVFEAARVYDVEDAIAFDYRVKWDSEVDASVQIYTFGGLARVPVSLKNMKFEGTVRVILTPLMKSPPGYGSILISFTKPPKINLDIRVLGGELTKLPFLKREITSSMQKAIADELLWPRRTIIPSVSEKTKRPLLTSAQVEALKKADPLLLAEKALAEDPMLKSVHSLTTPMKDKSGMFELSEDFNTTNVSDVGLDIVQYHHEIERGIVWNTLKSKLDESSQEIEAQYEPALPSGLINATSVV